MELAYVNDAMAQNNLTGANELMATWVTQAQHQAATGLITTAQASTFTTKGNAIVRQIPDQGKVTNLIGFENPLGALPQCARKSDSLDAAKSVSDIIRILLQGVLHEIPEVGAILAALLEILWPDDEADPNQVWKEIEDKITKQINQSLDDATKRSLDATLTGLEGVLHNYAVALNDKKNTAYLQETYVTALNHLTHDVPSFSSPARAYLVLPEYVQANGLLITQLRDGIEHASDLGLSAAVVADYQKQLTAAIATGQAYVAKQQAETHKSLPTSSDAKRSNVINYNENASLDLTLVPMTSDLSFFWTYMDPAKYPKPVTAINTRIIYSPLAGTIDNNGTPSPNGAGLKPITHFTMWGYDRLDAIQVSYGGVQGPRQGDQNGGSNSNPHGFDISVGAPTAKGVNQEGPLVAVFGYTGDVPEALGFTYADGNDTGLQGNGSKGRNFAYGEPGEVVAYAKVNGVSDFYDSADSIQVGFRYADSWS